MSAILVLWFRTTFLMPIGWCDREGSKWSDRCVILAFLTISNPDERGVSVYHQSPFYNNWNIRHVRRYRETKTSEDPKSFWFHARSCGFVLMVLWICVGNLNVLFATFTWSQYTRFVSLDGYKALIDSFGSFLWTAAVFSIIAGVAIDLISAYLAKRS